MEGFVHPDFATVTEKHQRLTTKRFAAGEASDAVRCRVIVSGRVQGVFYRDTCRRVADRLGLGGWVRNNDDGTVEAVMEGDRDDVGELVAWCREGPPRAVVINVQVIDEPVAGEGPFRVIG